VALNPREWEVLGQRGGWECPICRRWWPGSKRRECKAHCKSFAPLSSVRPILRRKSDGHIFDPATLKPIIK
jgi:hypothetical protein